MYFQETENLEVSSMSAASPRLVKMGSMARAKVMGAGLIDEVV